jgi:lysyl-tRNA synthetase class 2
MEMQNKTNAANWQSTATINNLRRRAELLQQIRAFFSDRKVLEVSTPVIGEHTVTEPNIESLSVIKNGNSQQICGHLQTSPEYMMKRLLAAGSGPIYQICQAFRQEENGRYHNQEFTMLEWYRPGFDEADLMKEANQLLQTVAYTVPALRISYHDLFQNYLQLNPHQTSMQQLAEKAKKNNLNGLAELSSDNIDTALQLLLSHIIEPAMRKDVSSLQPVFIYNFPESQSALAKIKNDPQGIIEKVAARFEIYWRGIEIANGFNELTDAKEQQQRFINEQKQRHAKKQNVPQIDMKFIAALEHGLPQCSGIALGLDRLCMLACNSKSLAEVINFI